MVALKTVNKAITAKWPGKDLELVKGDDYFYFVGAGTEVCKTASVYVPRLNDLTIDQWMAEAEGLLKEVAEKTDPTAHEPGIFRLAKKPTV